MPEVDGVGEFVAAQRRAAADLPKVFRAAKLKGAGLLLAAVVDAWPKKSGRMAASFRVFATKTSAGVRSTHPGAGVQEFAKNYLRARPGGGQSRLSSHQQAQLRSSTPGGYVRVRMRGNAPRYAVPARNRVQDEAVELADEALTTALRADGWFSEDR